MVGRGRKDMKEVIKKIPILGGLTRRIYRKTLARLRNPERFPGSAAYLEMRYRDGGNSGVGSYGLFGGFKADVLNEFVAIHNVQRIIDFGCGDGNQLMLARYPAYLGLDVSSTAVSQCQELFKSDKHKSFKLMSQYNEEDADLALSLDVIYHLAEDDVFEQYMQTLFSASNRYVIIYSSDSDDNRGYEGTHIRHRQFTKWIQENLPKWKLVEHLPNRYPYRGDYLKGSFAEFFIYEKV
jgi:SAM-dependent methyltransferase